MSSPASPTGSNTPTPSPHTRSRPETPTALDPVTQVAQDSLRSVALQLETMSCGFAIANQTPGVVVTQIDPESISAKAGLKEGDCILLLGITKITSVEDFKAALDALEEGARVHVFVKRGDRYDFVSVQKQQALACGIYAGQK